MCFFQQCFHMRNSGGILLSYSCLPGAFLSNNTVPEYKHNTSLQKKGQPIVLYSFFANQYANKGVLPSQTFIAY